jgi:hypothetical protein
MIGVCSVADRTKTVQSGRIQTCRIAVRSTACHRFVYVEFEFLG